MESSKVTLNSWVSAEIFFLYAVVLILCIIQDFHLLVTNPRKQKLTIQVNDSIGLTDITIGTGEVQLK